MIALSLLLATILAEPQILTPPPPETGSAKAAPAGRQVAWAHSYAEAVEMARQKADGRILVFLTEKDCGECDRQAALIIPSTTFYGFTLDKVPVQIPFSSPDGRKLAERFELPGPPAWIVLTPDGLLCGLQGGRTNQGDWVETFVRTEQSWVDYKKRLEQEQKNPTDLSLVYAIAEETYKRGGNESAEPRFRRLSTAASVPPKTREESLAYLASIEMDANRIADAEKDLQALLAIATDGTLRERAEFHLAEIEIARGRKDLAIARLKRFKKEHPASSFGKDADQLLARLDPAPTPGTPQ